MKCACAVKKRVAIIESAQDKRLGELLSLVEGKKSLKTGQDF